MKRDKQMTESEQQMIDMGCPECGGNIELYDTNPTGTGGKYRCLDCGRDTVWAIGKALSVTDMLNSMGIKMGKPCSIKKGK